MSKTETTCARRRNTAARLEYEFKQSGLQGGGRRKSVRPCSRHRSCVDCRLGGEVSHAVPLERLVGTTVRCRAARGLSLPVTFSRSSVKRWSPEKVVLDGMRVWAGRIARAPGVDGARLFRIVRARRGWFRERPGPGSDRRTEFGAVHRAGPRLAAGTLPVPADLLVYTAREWEALHARGGRFARVLAAETVWLIGPRA